MGNGTSKRKGSEDGRGRKQRSAAERLVDSRKSGECDVTVYSSFLKPD